MKFRTPIFIGLAAACLVPGVTAPLALIAGMTFSLSWGNPLAAESKKAQTWLLQSSVVGLGAAMNLEQVLRVGASGLLQTALGIGGTLALTFALTKALRTERTTSLLIGVGTAICGGSAIAAVAPAIGAKPNQTSLALAVVFLLNALALFVFPPIGHALGMTPSSFGLWCALAIHDTSSVVGASMQFGDEALGIATTVKLARALWIIPVTLVLSRVWKREEGVAAGAPKRPWFIFGFLAVAALVTWVPALHAAGQVVAVVARQVLVLTLFLVGAGVSRQTLKEVGARPVVLGVLLWVVVASASLWSVR